MEWIAWFYGSILGLLGLFVVWLILSIKIIGPAEMAVKVIFGEPVEFCDSGWVIDFRFPLGRQFKCFLQRYPKKMYDLDYPAQEAITKAGEYKGVFYGAQTVKVDATAYLNFPREVDKKLDIEKDESGKIIRETHPLIKILRAGIPIEDEKLNDWTEEAVIGAIRASFGRMTWMKVIEDMGAVSKGAEKVFKDADGALIKAGFRDPGIRLVITEIRLPPELEKAMPRLDQSRIEADAAQYVADRRAIETVGAVIKMMAQSRGKTSDEIRAQIEADPELQREFLKSSQDWITRQMAIDGRSFVDIRVEGAEGFEKMILDALTVWQRMPQGGRSRGKAEEDEAAEEKMSLEESEARMRVLKEEKRRKLEQKKK